MKKIMAIIVSTFIALVVSVGATGCDTNGGTNSTTTTTKETTEYVTTTEGDAIKDEYDAKKYITDTAIQDSMLRQEIFSKMYTPEIGSIEFEKEEDDYYVFTVTGSCAGYYGDYVDFKSCSFDAEVEVYKSDGHIYGNYDLHD